VPNFVSFVRLVVQRFSFSGRLLIDTLTRLSSSVQPTHIAAVARLC
jgi:hypothetical protein